MSRKKLGDMTLDELEQLAGRLEKAASTIRGAMGLMGGSLPKSIRPGYYEPPPMSPAEKTAISMLRQNTTPEIRAKRADREAFLAELKADKSRNGLMGQFHQEGAEEVAAVEDLGNIPEPT